MTLGFVTSLTARLAEHGVVVLDSWVEDGACSLVISYGHIEAPLYLTPSCAHLPPSAIARSIASGMRHRDELWIAVRN